jgi:hypothetical protein
MILNIIDIIFGHEFNQPLSNSLDNLIMLKQLTFGHEFNQPLSNSLDNLIMLEQLTLILILINHYL